MTRQEFKDKIQYWDDLIRFCYKNDIVGYLDDIVSNNEINDIIKTNMYCGNWQNIRNFLLDVCDPNKDYYRVDKYGCLQDLTDSDFYTHKDEIEKAFDNFDPIS